MKVGIYTSAVSLAAAGTTNQVIMLQRTGRKLQTNDSVYEIEDWCMVIEVFISENLMPFAPRYQDTGPFTAGATPSSCSSLGLQFYSKSLSGLKDQAFQSLTSTCSTILPIWPSIITLPSAVNLQ